jgi:putative transposase
MRVHRAPELLGALWSWTSSRVASSESACTAVRSMAPTSAASSIPPFMGRGAPRQLSTDHDPLFEAHRWTANLRILEIDEIKTVPHVPLSHPFVERLIGTLRREFLDHVLFWNARDRERKLADFQAYYNAARSHASLQGHTPSTFAGGHTVAPADLNNVHWVSHCRDLVQLPVAA